MKIIIERTRQATVEINTRQCEYPHAMREAIKLALELDGYDAVTIREIFGIMPETMEAPEKEQFIPIF